MTFADFLYVFIGGGLGAACRYIVTTSIGSRWDAIFPYGTLTVNTLGSFIIGFLTFYFVYHFESDIPNAMRLLLIVGFLGGFTTFSSFALETFKIASQQQLFMAFANIASNVGAVLIAVFLGLLAAKSLA